MTKIASRAAKTANTSVLLSSEVSLVVVREVVVTTKYKHYTVNDESLVVRLIAKVEFGRRQVLSESFSVFKILM